MNENLEQRLDRLNAMVCLQAAEISALTSLLRNVWDEGAAHGMNLPDLDKSFASRRNVYLHLFLESIESIDPARAAKLQQLIDQHSKQVPFDFDS